MRWAALKKSCPPPGLTLSTVPIYKNKQRPAPCPINKKADPSAPKTEDDPLTRKWAFTNLGGTFNTAFKLSETQFNYLIETGVAK